MARSIVISAGHSAMVRGAEGYIDEFDENCRVVYAVAERLRRNGALVSTFVDMTSSSQNANLEAIVDYHNSKTRDLDVSVHFNSHKTTSKPVGTEVWYVTQEELAADLASAMADAGHLVDRGAKYTDGLYFLNQTEQPAVLLEVCFVDSKADVDLYKEHFGAICQAIADTLAPPAIAARPPQPGQEQIAITATVFGGASDPNNSAYDGLPLNDSDLYVALPYRFEGERPLVRVINPGTARSAVAEIRDVGPWMIDDDYWAKGSRPIAELCCRSNQPLPDGPNAGEVPTNSAGIDLSPRLAKLLGIDGKGVVDWAFATPSRSG